MDFDKIRTIIGKEWAEVFKNRLVLFSVAFLPLIFIALPIITLEATAGIEAGTPEEVTAEAEELPGYEAFCADFSAGDCVNAYMLNIYTLMFMILPVAIPVTIAAYSIVGEKTTRSLEPLLATPITTLELLAGKALAAIVPAVAATWISFFLYALAVRLIATEQLFAYLLQPMWLLAVFVVGPLLTLMSVSVAIMISSRVSDPRVAEQLSMVVIVPVIVGVVGQSVGLFLLNEQLVLIAGMVILLLDAVLVYFAVKVFQRERILTQWK